MSEITHDSAGDHTAHGLGDDWESELNALNRSHFGGPTAAEQAGWDELASSGPRYVDVATLAPEGSITNKDVWADWNPEDDVAQTIPDSEVQQTNPESQEVRKGRLRNFGKNLLDRIGVGRLMRRDKAPSSTDQTAGEYMDHINRLKYRQARGENLTLGEESAILNHDDSQRALADHGWDAEQR